MRPHLRKDGRWSLTIQRNKVSKTFYDTTSSGCIKQAQAWDGKPTTKINVEVSMNQWLENEVKNKAAATYEQYKYLFNKHIKEIIGKIKVSKVLPVNCQSVINQMNQKKLSTATMRHARKVMHVYFEYERVMRKTISENPCADIYIPKRRTTRPRRSATNDELQFIWKRMSKTYYFYCYQFIFITGVRPSEACGIKLKDVTKTTIKITEGRTRRDVSSGKTLNAERMISIPSVVYDLVLEQRKMLEKLNIASEYLFPNRDGGPSNSGLLSVAWGHIKKNSGIDLTLYELRHTFTSMMYDNMPLKEMQAYIGHSSSMDTGGTYAHIFRKEDENTANSIGNILSGSLKVEG